MPKRRALIKKIQAEAGRRGLDFSLLREGAGHSVYVIDGIRVPIPRHTHINEYTAEAIYKEAGEALGKDWWRR